MKPSVRCQVCAQLAQLSPSCSAGASTLCSQRKDPEAGEEGHVPRPHPGGGGVASDPHAENHLALEVLPKPQSWLQSSPQSAGKLETEPQD